MAGRNGIYATYEIREIDSREIREAIEKQFGKESKNVRLLNSKGVYFIEAKIFKDRWTCPLDMDPTVSIKDIAPEEVATLMFKAFYEILNTLNRFRDCRI